MSLCLDRIKNFLSDENIEYNKLKYIHIAGTNGKGSTAKMLADILKNCGYKTGLYTSPHLIKINERIQINSVSISDKDLAKIEEKYNKIFKKYALTYFERITAAAFIYFVKNNTDVAVLETGLGGRFDATNIVTPLVSVITSIGLDHMEILGETLEEIAFEKAGIIKKDVPAVCGNISETALKEIYRCAEEKNSQVFVFGKDFNAGFLGYDRKEKNSLQRIIYNSELKNYPQKNKNFPAEFKTSLLGKAQVYNTAIVLKTCEILKDKLNKINFDTVKETLQNIKWPARFDIREIKINNKNFSLIIDGAHNEQAVENFLDVYKQSPFYKKENKLCFAVMQEKSYKKIIRKLVCEFKNINLIKLDNSRAVDTEILKKEFSKYTDENKIFIYDDIAEILKNTKNNDVLVFFGSFFLAGKILETIDNL